MGTMTIRVLQAIALIGMAACGSGTESDAGLRTETAPDEGQDSESEPSSSVVAVNEVYPEVDRTRTGDGGIIAIAGEMTMEFDYSPPQGSCKVSDIQFKARGVDINDESAGVSITQATIIAPDTGRTVGETLVLEVLKDGYKPWVVSVGVGLAGSVKDISREISPGGGTTLVATGTIAGFRKDTMHTGIKKPFRLEATCDP